MCDLENTRDSCITSCSGGRILKEGQCLCTNGTLDSTYFLIIYFKISS